MRKLVMMMMMRKLGCVSTETHHVLLKKEVGHIFTSVLNHFIRVTVLCVTGSKQLGGW